MMLYKPTGFIHLDEALIGLFSNIYLNFDESIPKFSTYIIERPRIFDSDELQ